MAGRRSHVVPAGYQRFFADGERIGIVDKHVRAPHRPQGVKDTFVSGRFLHIVRADGTVDDSAEDSYGVVEDAVLPVIRGLDPSRNLSSEEASAVLGLMALLFSRSFAIDIVRKRLIPLVVEEHAAKMERNRKTRRLFHSEFGRSPTPGELVRIVAQQAERMETARRDAVMTMVRYDSWFIERFEDHYVSLYVAPRPFEFVTSDNPVVIAQDPHLLHLGVHNGLAVDDAGFAFVPLTPRLGACLTKDREPAGRLTPLDMYRLNNATWRNAVRWVAFHPSCDWAAACSVARSSR